MVQGIPEAFKQNIGSVIRSVNNSMAEMVNGLSIGGLTAAYAGAGLSNTTNNQNESYQFFAPVTIGEGNSTNLGEYLKARRF